MSNSKKKILVVGSGGREHALIWRLSQSSQVSEILCAPGNGGIKDLAQCVDIQADDVEGLVELARQEKVDLTVVGPELALSLGIRDAFDAAGLKLFGPSQKASILEFSKAFTKDFCERHQIPTAQYKLFDQADPAFEYLKQKNQYPIVLKADGLAAGKGVIVAESQAQAFEAVSAIMEDKKFGEAGNKLVIEDFLKGEEATYMVLCDGENFIPFQSCQDHKPIYDGDKGPNTGGMGAYSPAPVVDAQVEKKVQERIIRPTLKGMKEEGREYQGILYAGLMIDNGEPSVVEFNCRFGDPEAQAILFRLKTDLVDLIESSLAGKLDQQKIEFDPQAAVCVVMSAEGYPGSYARGQVIQGLEEAKEQEDTFVFHAGTKTHGEEIVTNGGRVLGVTAKGDGLSLAIDRAYDAVEMIEWPGKYYREDIGVKGLKRK